MTIHPSPLRVVRKTVDFLVITILLAGVGFGIPHGGSIGPASWVGQYEFASAGPGSNYYWAGAESYDSAALSNTGIRGTIQVTSIAVVGCLSFWVADEMASNTVWGQVGYYICNGSTPIAFYQVWSNGSVATTGTTPVAIGPHQFSMNQQSGTIWAYSLDGSNFGSYAMNSSASSSTYPIEALSEEGYVNSTWNPPQVEFSAIQVLKSGSWYSPQNGYEPYGCGSTGLSCWGVAGNVQNSTLPVDAIIVGGTTPLVATGAWLWNNSTADFTMTASPASLTANAGVAATSTITIAPLNGFTATVTLGVTANSTGLSCTLSPATIASGSGASTLSCTGSLGGDYLATVTGTSGTLSHTVTVAYRTQDFALSANPITIKASLGSRENSTIAISPQNGFAQTVTLSSMTNSTNFSCFLNQTSITGSSGTSTLSCTASQSGFFTVTVTGVSGSLTHSVTLTYEYASANFLLEVNAPASGVMVTVDGTSLTTNSSGWVSLRVENGTHTILIEPTLPVSMGPLRLPFGITSDFSSWNTGATANPLTINVGGDVILVAVYRTTIQSSFYMIMVAVIALIVVMTLAVRRKGKHPVPEDPNVQGMSSGEAFPRNFTSSLF